ncbi:MAG TPA: tetratricopeptide repeat protein [Phycisphaerae bacterium]|nr:tetratricopeptide repeat protein [Phycisphaerae bacterium]
MAQRLNKKLVAGLTIAGILITTTAAVIMTMNLPQRDPGPAAEQAAKYAAEGDYRNALDSYQRAYRRSLSGSKTTPESNEYMLQIGEMFLALGEARNALGAWQRVVLNDPQNEPAQQKVVAFLVEMIRELRAGTWSNVQAEAEKLLSINPKNFVGTHAMGLALTNQRTVKEENLKKGEEYLKESFDGDKSNADFAESLASHYTQENQDEKAAQVFDDLMSNLPKEPAEQAKAWRTRGRFFLIRSVRDRQEMLRKESERAAPTETARLEQQIAQAEAEAMRCFEEAIKLAPENVENQISLGEYWMMKRVTAKDEALQVEERKANLAKSEECFTRAIQLDKDGYQAYMRLANLHLGNQDMEKALQVLATRQQRGVQREGYLGPRNRYFMARLRGDMFRILMLQADTARGQAAGSASQTVDKALAQMQGLRDEQAGDTGEEDPSTQFMDARINILRGNRFEAIKDLEAATKLATDNPELHQYLAQLYMQIGELGKADESLRSVLRGYPDNAQAWALRATLMAQLNEHDAAIQDAERSLRIDPRNRTALIALGRAYEAQKNWDKVKEIARQLAEGTEDPVQAKLQQAAIYLAENQAGEERKPEMLLESEKLLREVLAEDPGNMIAIQQLALLTSDPNRPGEIDPKRAEEIRQLLADQRAAVEAKLKEASAATQPAQQTIDDYERTIAALDRLAVLADASASPEERMKRLEEVIKRGNDPFVVAVQLYQLYAPRPERSKEALEQLHKAYEINPDQPSIVEALFARALEDKDWTAAEKYINEAVRLGLARAGGHFHRGRMLTMRTDLENNYEQAIAEFRAGLRIFPTYSQGHVMLGRVLAEVKRNDEAAQSFREALRLNPTNGMAALGLATIAAVRGDEAEKNTYLRVCERLMPDHPWVKAELQAMEDTRDPKRGITRREEIRKSNPTDIPNLLRLASLYQNDSQPDRAKAVYEEAYKLESMNFRVIQAYTDFLRTKRPPENEQALKVLKTLVDSIEKDNTLQKATAQLLMATHMEAVRQQGGADVPTTQAVDEAFVAAAQMCQEPPVSLDVGNYFLAHGRFEDAEKWYREALARAQAQEDADLEKSARQNIIESIVRLQDPNREDELKKEIDSFREKYDDPFAFLAESEYHINAGRLDDALTAINEFVKLRPDNADGRLRRGDIHFQRSMWQDALEDYRVAKTQEPKGYGYRHRIRMALCLEHLGQNDLAVSEFLSILADEPNHDATLDELLRLYIQLSQWQDAERLFVARLKADPDNPEWSLRLLTLYRSSKELEKAIGAGVEAAQKSQYADVAVDQLLQTFLQFERFDELLRFVNDRLPAAKRQYHGVELAVAAAYAGKGDRGNALRLYGQRLDTATANMEAFAVIVGDIKKRLGAQVAKQVIQQRLAAKPDERASRFVLGALQKDAGEREAYLEALKSLLETIPKDDSPGTIREKLYLMQCQAIEHYLRGEFKDARKTYEDILTINPNHLISLNNLAYLLMDHFNDPTAALPYARRAANMVPFDPNVLDTVGWNHVLLGNYKLGIAALRRAMGMNDKVAAIHYHAAEAFYRRANAEPQNKDADLREAETECRRAYNLIRAAGTDHEGIFDRVLALGEKLGLRLDPKLSPK